MKSIHIGETDREKVAEVLLKNGANLNAHDNDGRSILESAVTLSNLFYSETVLTYFIIYLSFSQSVNKIK